MEQIIKITETVKRGATVFDITPNIIFLGGKDASLVDSLRFDIPESWTEKTVRVTFIPNWGGMKSHIAYLLATDDTVIDIDTAITSFADGGTMMVDAIDSNGYAAYTTEAKYEMYLHSTPGGANPEPKQNEWMQFVNQVEQYAQSSHLDAKNAQKSEEDAELALQQTRQIVSDFQKSVISVEHGIENSGTEQLQKIVSEANKALLAIQILAQNAQKQIGDILQDALAAQSAIEAYCDEQQGVIDGKVAVATNAAAAAASAKIDAVTAQQNAETAARTATQKAADAAAHDILTQTDLTDAQKATARKNIDAAKVEGNYELIETITLTEDTAEIVRTQEPDGTAYNFKDVMIRSHFLQANQAGYVLFYANFDLIYSRSSQVFGNYQNCLVTSANGYWSQFHFGKKFGRWLFDYTGYTSTTSSGAIVGSSYGTFFQSLNDNIVSLKIFTPYSMPAGSTIEIYGVRA